MVDGGLDVKINKGSISAIHSSRHLEEVVGLNFVVFGIFSLGAR
jgi:hypothetical protein